MKVGVIGAGTMGAGIAQVFAQVPDNRVILSDVSEEFVKRGLAQIEKALRRMAAKGKCSEDEAEAALARVCYGKTEDMADLDLIVEAAPERLELKKNVFQQLDLICRDDCIFASNTSSLSVTEIGSGLRHPLLGMHFFNPAPVMKLVEVVEGIDTPPEITEKICETARAAGKIPVVVKDSAGFVVNRMLIPMINEAIGILAEGVASAEDIDQAMKLGANHPIGPLALGDLVGLDVVLAIMEVLQSETGDSKYRPHPLLKKMVRAGRLGKKTGAGFYSYEGR